MALQVIRAAVLEYSSKIDSDYPFSSSSITTSSCWWSAGVGEPVELKTGDVHHGVTHMASAHTLSETWETMYTAGEDAKSTQKSVQVIKLMMFLLRGSNSFQVGFKLYENLL